MRSPPKKKKKKRRQHQQQVVVGVAAKMFRSPPPPRLKVVDLNPHLSCILCGGYFIDATTITECLHSFCRACIVRYLETSEYCPVCEVQVHKSKPLRSDKILQDIVYKLVPGLYNNEMKRRRELYASQPPEALRESRDAEDRGEEEGGARTFYAPDEIFSLSIEYGKEVESQDSSTATEEDNTPGRRFLRCPAALTVLHLKKFIRMKYGLSNAYQVDLRYDQDSLPDEYTLMDVAYIFLWKRRGPLRFFFKIVERPPKKPKPEPVSANAERGVTKEAEAKEESADECVRPQQAVSSTETGPRSPAVELNAKDLTPKPDAPVGNSRLEEEAKVDEKEKKREESAAAVGHFGRTESKPNPFKFPPISLGKASSESKPAVMTVAPLTKPSSSLPTTSTTPATGTITHGLYTGISIKKSPPNTLPPFKISAHLLPPRVPPLKLSPPRFTKLEACLKEMSSSKKSSASRKSKSSRGGSSDKLELKVAQLKSASVKCVAPLVISVPPEAKSENRREMHGSPSSSTHEKKSEGAPAKVPAEELPRDEHSPSHPKECPPPPVPEAKTSTDEDKMDLDSDLFEGRLVIAEPDVPLKEDSGDGRPACDPPATKLDDSEDEEIDVVDDVDSGRGSDISSRTEARSLCGDDDLGSPESVPKTPEAERHLVPGFPDPPGANGTTPLPAAAKTAASDGSDCGVLDLSTCSRKRAHDGDVPVHRAKQVANPAVLDKTRQTNAPCLSPNHSPFKVLSPEIPRMSLYKSRHESSRGNFKCRGNTLTVINPDPNGNRPKIVIRNLGPRPDRFHHHHHHHHSHHHQRM